MGGKKAKLYTVLKIYILIMKDSRDIFNISSHTQELKEHTRMNIHFYGLPLQSKFGMFAAITTLN